MCGSAQRRSARYVPAASAPTARRNSRVLGGPERRSGPLHHNNRSVQTEAPPNARSAGHYPPAESAFPGNPPAALVQHLLEDPTPLLLADNGKDARSPHPKATSPVGSI